VTATAALAALSETDLDAAARDLDAAPALDILRWAADRFAPRFGFGTGFGAEGCVLIDLIGRHQLPVDIFTLDTGLFFEETYELWRRLEQRYGITIRAVRPELDVDQQAARHGDELWRRDPDACCRMRKVEPLAREARRFDAWTTAIRRDQTAERQNARVLERDARFGLVKVNPLVSWNSAQIWRYLLDHDVPYNPLHDQGYPSIGCAPCTSPVDTGEDPRAGRWRGTAKTECGLHLVPLTVPARAPHAEEES
jgi:phosphoadenylyl-sulfate reductase (thioredoxin)